MPFRPLFFRPNLARLQVLRDIVQVMKSIDEGAVIREYESGNSVAKVADALGISATQVRRILKRNGVERRSNRTDAETEALVLERYERGESSEEIAESMDLHGTTVCRIIKRMGGRVRPPQVNKRKFVYVDCRKVLYSKNWLQSASADEKRRASEDVFSHFRRHGFPYPSFAAEERSQDFKRLCTTSAALDGDRIASANDAGLKLFKHYCRHYLDVRSNALPSMTDAFRDDKKLMAVIHNRMGISYKEVFNITGNMIRQGLRNSHTAFAASVFKPSVAKLIYDEFARDGNVLDISAGFGQRMVGAAASLRAESYTGIDPWKTTIDALTEMHAVEFPWFSVDLHCCGSESFIPKKKYNLCFSSPPFFDKEVYCDDDTQAYHGRDALSFVNNWWLPTASMIHDCLNSDGFFVLNMDETIAKQMIEASQKLFRVVRKMHLSFSRSHLPKGSKDTYFVMERA